MGISKNYQKALQIADENQEFVILEYIKGKSPQLKLKCLRCDFEFTRYQCHFIQYPHVCPKCHPKGASQLVDKEECQKRIDKIYGAGIYSIIEYKGNNTLSVFKCERCKNKFNSVPSSIWRGRTKGCPFCNKSLSIGESRIEKFLRDNNINFRRQERFTDCKDKMMLPFDFFLPQFNTCIEFQGEQHYNKDNYFWSETLIHHDKIKKNYCKEKNIKLIEIPYWDIDKIPTILGSFKSN